MTEPRKKDVLRQFFNFFRMELENETGAKALFIEEKYRCWRQTANLWGFRCEILIKGCQKLCPRFVWPGCETFTLHFLPANAWQEKI